MDGGMHLLNGNAAMEDREVDVDSDFEEDMTTAVGVGIGGIGGLDVSNGEAVMAKSSGQSAADQRIKRKAKRPSQYMKEAGQVVPGTPAVGPVVNAVRVLKNSRKSRTLFGRGLPKKGGAGGKGTWGRPGSEFLAEEDNETPGDPNYDSDSQDNYVLAALQPELTDEEIQKNVESIFLEYLEHGESEEVALSLMELNFGDKKYHIPLIAITLAMDRKPSHRELTSVLVSDLYPHVLSQTDIGKGFDGLLKNLPDIVLDTPEAPVVLGNFVARAVADDCLPPKFLATFKDVVISEYARAAVERSNCLLSMKHGLVRLDNVWGVGGGTRPVKYLIKKMVLLLKEYISSGDATEAIRCLKELEVPHFHHELVYEAVIMVLEDMSERSSELVCRLLKQLYAAVIVTPDQLKRGFERVYEDMPDICIDVPPAYLVLDRFTELCQQSGFLSEAVLRKMPSRGRKRFVSEGDGGRVKDALPL